MSSILVPLFQKRAISELSCILMILCFPLMSFSWNQPWPMAPGIIVDKLSVALMALSIWISILVLFLKPVDKFMKLNVLTLLWSLLFFFSTSSLVTFFILFEASLIPTLCLVLGWGYQPERLEASYYFIFYTITLSMPFLVSLLCLVKVSGSKYFHYDWIETLEGALGAYLLVIFMIKLPLFLGHLWLPKAHVEAPVVGSMLLAGILLKTGGYGVVRVFHYMNKNLVSLGLMVLGAIGMVYVCLLCLACADMKQLIAYSSVSHMNFMLVGLMNNALTSCGGGIIMMISHGLCSSLMFMISDMAYKRSGSRSIVVNKGLLVTAPAASLLWAVTSVLNMGIPPSAGSLSELLIITAAKNLNLWYDFLFILYLFLSAFYSIYLYTCVNHGKSMMTTNGVQTKEVLLSIAHLTPLVGLTLMTKHLLM